MAPPVSGSVRWSQSSLSFCGLPPVSRVSGRVSAGQAAADFELGEAAELQLVDLLAVARAVTALLHWGDAEGDARIRLALFRDHGGQQPFERRLMTYRGLVLV